MCIVQTQLDEETSDMTSSSDNGDDDDMPKLSPVTDVCMSTSVDTPSIVHASTSLTPTGTVQRPCSTAENSVETKPPADDVYCICRTPYDETKSVYLQLVMCPVLL